MRIPFAAILACWAMMSVAWAQFGNFGDVPVEIRAVGGTRFDGGVAIA
jgi:hypothetical protein